MTKTEIVKKNQEHLEKLKNKLPKYDWKLIQFKELKSHYELDEIGDCEIQTDEKWFYETEIYNQSKGLLKISYDGLGINIEGSFVSNDGYKYGRNFEFGDENKTNMEFYNSNNEPLHFNDEVHRENYIWENTQLFFDTFLIPREERLENKLHTPRIDKLFKSMFNIYTYEYNEVMMRLLFDDGMSGERKVYDEMFNKIEKHYNENSKNPNTNGYYGEPIELVKSILGNKDCEELMEGEMNSINDTIDEEKN